jgi:hypothetical protein
MPLWRAGVSSPVDHLPLRDLEVVAAARVPRRFEDDPHAIADPHCIGFLLDDVARYQDAGCVRERNEHDGVRYSIGEQGVHRLRDHRDTLDSTPPGAREAAELEALARFADVLGRMLDVLALLALLQRQHAGREEVAIERIEGRQSPALAEDARHSGAPNSTALPGQ